MGMPDAQNLLRNLPLSLEPCSTRNGSRIMQESNTG